MSFGDRVRAARMERGWTQEMLSAQMGIHGISICRYERNQYAPTLRSAIRLAAALGVSLDELAQDEIAEVRDEIAEGQICIDDLLWGSGHERETTRETPKCVSRETDGGREK